MIKNRKPSLLINGLSNWAFIFCNITITFIMTPFIIKMVGKGGYGIWGVASSLIGYYGLFNLGVTSAVSRYIARAIGNKDFSKINEVYNSALNFFIYIGTALIIVSVLFSSRIVVFFNVDDYLQNDFQKVILLLGLSSGISFPTGVMIAAFTAHERYVIENIFKILLRIIKAFMVFWLLKRGYGVIGVAYASLVDVILRLFVNIFKIIRFCPWIQFSLLAIKKKVVKELLFFGLPNMVLSVAVLLRVNLDNVVIGKFIGMEAVAVYSIASMIIRYASMAVNSGVGVITPRLYRYSVDDNGEKFYNLYYKGNFFSSLLASIACILVFLFGRRFLFLWVGQGFEESVSILYILSISKFWSLFHNSDYPLLIALNKHRKFTFIILGEAIVNVILSIYLASNYGIVGVALGTTIPLLVVKTVIQPLYVVKITKISLRKYYEPMLIPLTITFFLILIFTKIKHMNQIIQNSSLYELCLLGIIMAAIAGSIELCIVKRLNRKLIYSA